MVPEAAVVCVLLHRHDLDGVVAQRPDARQHVAPELQVAVDLGLGAGHAHVALVDAQRAGPGGRQVAEGGEGRWRRVYDRAGRGGRGVKRRRGRVLGTQWWHARWTGIQERQKWSVGLLFRCHAGSPKSPRVSPERARVLKGVLLVGGDLPWRPHLGRVPVHAWGRRGARGTTWARTRDRYRLDAKQQRCALPLNWISFHACVAHLIHAGMRSTHWPSGVSSRHLTCRTMGASARCNGRGKPPSV